MIDPRHAGALVGAPVFTAERTYLGTIDGVTQDGPGVTPRWAHLRHDGVGVVLPLAAAQLHTWGVELPFSATLVHGAPSVAADAPSADDLAALTVHYGQHEPPTVATGPGPVGADSGDGVSVLRSAERAHVRVETVPVERIRLRRTIVTEERTITVTVRKEVLVVERTPLGDEPVPARGVVHQVGSTDEDVVVVLREERPVVTLEVVPVERVTLHRSTVTAEQLLTTALRSEQVEILPAT